MNKMREALAESEYKVCASCNDLKVKWEHLKNPDARKPFYDKADLFLATETKDYRIAVIKKGESPSPSEERIINIIEDVDCCGEVFFTTSLRTRRLLGWAKRLIDAIAQEQKQLSDEFYRGDE